MMYALEVVVLLIVSNQQQFSNVGVFLALKVNIKTFFKLRSLY